MLAVVRIVSRMVFGLWLFIPHMAAAWPNEMTVQYHNRGVTLSLAAVTSGAPEYTHAKLGEFVLRIEDRLLVKHLSSVELASLDELNGYPVMPLVVLPDGVMWSLVKLPGPNEVVSLANTLPTKSGILLAEPDFLQRDGATLQHRTNSVPFAEPKHFVRQALQLEDWPPLAGKGIRVAVIDSAFDITDSALNLSDILLNYDTHLLDTARDKQSASRTVFNDPYHGNASLSLLWGNGRDSLGLAPFATPILIERSVNWGSEVAFALQLASSAKADVVACPWTLRFTPQVVSDAVTLLTKYGREGKGTVVVAAAGNTSFPIDNSFSFAAEPELIVINAASSGTMWPAKSQHIGVTMPVPYLIKQQGRTISYSGTSAASIAVSGVVATLLSIGPTFTAQDIKHLLIRFSTPELNVTNLLKEVEAEIKKTTVDQ